MPLSYNLRTILIDIGTHTVEFSELFSMYATRYTTTYILEPVGEIYMLGRYEFMGRIDRNSLASDWSLGKR